MKVITLTDQSFRFAENEVLRDFLTYLRPGLVIPMRKKLKSLIMDKYYYKKEEMKSLFRTVWF
jgi:hypothetical protein